MFVVFAETVSVMKQYRLEDCSTALCQQKQTIVHPANCDKTRGDGRKISIFWSWITLDTSHQCDGHTDRMAFANNAVLHFFLLAAIWFWSYFRDIPIAQNCRPTTFDTLFSTSNIRPTIDDYKTSCCSFQVIVGSVGLYWPALKVYFKMMFQMRRFQF